MIFAKNIFKRTPLLVIGTMLAFLGNIGCGGETGGSPNGIAGALTKGSILKVSSFALTASSAVTRLRPTVQGDLSYKNVTEVKGALYPTRNSQSFRVVLKGAGANLEDVVYYFDIYDKANGAYRTTKSATAPPDSTNPADDLNYTVQGESTSKEIAYTTIDQLYVSSGRAVTPAGVTVNVSSATSGVGVYEVVGAYSYSQPRNGKAVRKGVRNVLVQFFQAPAKDVQREFEEILARESGDAKASHESAYLGGNLTNSYVFTTNVEAGKPIDLTNGFAANNGENGLVDSKDLPVRITSGMPVKWGSVKFEAYEEASILTGKGISFSKIVNFADRKAPGNDYDETTRALTSGIRFANRQRVLKVYATCYDLENGAGAVLAQTQENGKLYNVANYPVVLIPTISADPGPLFFPVDSAEGAVVATDTLTALKDLHLVSAIKDYAATIPILTKGAGAATVAATADTETQPRYSFNQVPVPLGSSSRKTLNERVITIVNDPVANQVASPNFIVDFNLDYFGKSGSTLADGQIAWTDRSFADLNPTTTGIDNADLLKLTVADLYRITFPLPGSPLNPADAIAGDASSVRLIVGLKPDAGLLAGTVKGVKR